MWVHLNRNQPVVPGGHHMEPPRVFPLGRRIRPKANGAAFQVHGLDFVSIMFMFVAPVTSRIHAQAEFLLAKMSKVDLPASKQR